MSVYPATKIRNVCLLGHGGDGKTSLIESLLYMTKNTDRLGKIADGNTVSDFDPEEIKRKFSISSSIAPVEFYERRPCILQFMRVPLDFRGAADADPEGLYQNLFGDFLKYMEEHNMEACGDALALKIGYSKEEDQKWQYILLHLPVVQK